MSFLEDRLNGEDHDLVLQMGVCRGFVRIAAPVTLAWRRHPQSETGDFTSNILGALRLVVREKSGTYPGGSERSRERRRIIGRHTRPVALACLRKDALKQGWKLYRATLKWNLQLGQWKYVLGFPILALLAFLSRAFRAHHKGIQ